MSGIFSIVSIPLGWVMMFIYKTVQNYGLTLIIFTLFTKIILFPLSIKQQKSMAKQAAYQPMIKEINKKWANDKKRQQEEYLKLQQEYGFSPTAGCLPLLLQFPILIGLIDVIYKPLRYIIGMPKEVIAQAQEVAGSMMKLSSYSPESTIIQAVQTAPEKFAAIFEPDKMQMIQSFNLNFLGFNLSEVPTIALNLMILIPILSAGTMILSQVLTSKMNGSADQMEGSMKYMPYIMSLSFVYFAFVVPAGVSFYWIFSNVFGIVQAYILKKMYDPEVYKKQIAEEIELKKAAKKQKKQVQVETPDGTLVKKDVTEAELARIRLQKARELDAKRYED